MYVFNKGVDVGLLGLFSSIQVIHDTGEDNLASRAVVSATPSLGYQ